MLESAQSPQSSQPASWGCTIAPSPDALARAAVELSAKKRRYVSKLEPQLEKRSVSAAARLPEISRRHSSQAVHGQLCSAYPLGK